MASTWFKKLQGAQKTCLIQDGRRKVHYTFSDKIEMVEEYDLKTFDLIIRKWKGRGRLGGDGNWEFEVGEDLRPRRNETEGLIESNVNPIFVRKDTKKAFQWRIRNLPYPLPTYDVKVDDDQKCIIIRTTNKKYYKKFSIPDLGRVGLTLDQSNIGVTHANNTLIVTYSKPAELVTVERMIQTELEKMKSIKDGDMEMCSPS